MFKSAGSPMRLKTQLLTFALALCVCMGSNAFAVTSNYIPVAVNTTTTTVYASTTPGRVGVDKAGNVFYINHASPYTLYEVPASAPTTQVPLIYGLAATGSNAAFVDASGALWVTIGANSITLVEIPAANGIPNTALVTGASGYVSANGGLQATTSNFTACAASPAAPCYWGTTIGSSVTSGYISGVVDVYSDGAGNVFLMDDYDNVSSGAYDRIIRFNTSAPTTGYLLADQLSLGVGGQNTVAQLTVAGDGNVYYVDSKTHGAANGNTYLIGPATATSASTPTQVGTTATIGSAVQVASGTAVGISTDPWGNLIIAGPLELVEVPLESGSLNFLDEFGLVNAAGQSTATFPIYGQNIRSGGTFDIHGNYYYSSAANVMQVQIGGYNFGSVAVGTLTAAPYTDFIFNILAANAYHMWPTYSMNNTGSLSLLQSFPYSSNKSFTGGTTLSAGTAVDLQMDFQPVHAGLLRGAYAPQNGNANAAGVYSVPWTTVNLQGVGTGPQALLLPTPGTASTAISVSTPVYTSSSHSTSATSFKPAGLAVDTFGDIFVADTANKTVDVNCLTTTALAAASTVNTGTQTGIYCQKYAGYTFELNTFVSPIAVALDGGNTAYVLDNSSTGNPLTKLVSSYNGSAYSLVSVVTIPTGATVGGTALSNPQGITLDGYGTIYIADTGNNRIIQAHQSGATYSQNIVYVPSSTTFGGTALSGPTGMAVDSAGDLFIADTGNNRIVEYSVAGVAKVVTASGITLTAPTGVSVLASGTLLVTDKTNVASLIDGGVGTALNFIASTGSKLTPLGAPAALAMDIFGNIYVSDPTNSQVVEVNVNTFPVIMPTFPSTTVGHASPDMYLDVFNVGVGNTALTFSAAPSISETTDFAIDNNTTTCTITSGAAANTDCVLAVFFQPQSAGVHTTTAALTENQNVAAGFTAVSNGYGYTGGTFATSSTTQAATFSSTFTPQIITFANPGTQTVGIPLTLVATTTAPGLIVSFAADPTTTSVCTVSGNTTIGFTATFLASGTCLINASQAGNSIYGPATVSQTFTVNGTPQTITFNNPGTQLYVVGLTVPLSASTTATGLTVSFASGTTSVCTVNSNGTSASILSTGTCTITASQAGTAVYAAATPVIQSFLINNPLPVISSISNTFASWGAPTSTITIVGTGFVPSIVNSSGVVTVPSSTAYWGTTAMTTTYVSPTQLTAVVQIYETDNAGIYAITVQSSAPGGGTSNAMQFEVDSEFSAPTPPNFTTPSVTVAAGSSAAYPVTLPSSATNVSATCLNLPTGATCSYASNVVTIATLSSTPKGTYTIAVVFTETLPGAVTTPAFILLPFLLTPMLLVRRRLASRGLMLTVCIGIILFAGAAAVAGCGGSTVVATHQVTSTGAVTLIVH